MAKFSRGILGGFSGRVGTVVGSTWRGLEIMRARPRRTNRIPSEAQAEQRERFTLVAHFLRPIKPVLRLYFGQKAAEKSRSNLATAYHMTEALQGTFPNFTIDFQKVIIAKGELLGLQDLAVVALGSATLGISWTDNSGQGQAKTDDELIVAVYNPVKALWDYQLAAAARTIGGYTYQLPVNWTGDTVNCYVSVASANEKLYGNSVWFGGLVVS